MSERYEKNISKIQDMVDGNFKGKIQSGYETAEVTRKVGEKWTDSDGYKWEQKEGFKVKKGNSPAVGMFSKRCKDCEKPCVKKIDKETYNRMDRCMYCQIDFEAKLRTWPIKYWAWRKLQALQRWTALDKEALAYLDEKEKLTEKKTLDKSVANALANAEIDTNKIKLGG